jgi:predicted enzyme related to lactoylglutathione lyase
MSDQLVVGVDFVCVSAPDHEASVAFYEEVLGLERSKSWGNLPATEFETGNLTIVVVDWTALGRDNQPNPNAIVLAVEDVPAAKARLESDGVHFASDVIDSGSCHQAYFADPGGNALGIHSFYGERSRGG